MTACGEVILPWIWSSVCHEVEVPDNVMVGEREETLSGEVIVVLGGVFLPLTEGHELAENRFGLSRGAHD